MHGLIRVLEGTDPELARHSLRTAGLARQVAEEMGLTPEQVENVGMAARLHDIGKLFVSQEILTKPGPPTEEEWVELRLHPRIGYELVRDQVPEDIALIVLTHHERYDGGGYPDGLAGSEIPFEARALQVADAFDAITSVRPYQPALPIEYAISELQRYSGSQFDPKAVSAMLRLAAEPGWRARRRTLFLHDEVAV